MPRSPYVLATSTKNESFLNIVVLNEWEDVRERLFPDWAMELVSAEHIREELLRALNAAKDARTVQALRILLDDLNGGTLATLTVH